MRAVPFLVGGDARRIEPLLNLLRIGAVVNQFLVLDDIAPVRAFAAWDGVIDGAGHPFHVEIDPYELYDARRVLRSASSLSRDARSARAAWRPVSHRGQEKH